MSKGSDVKKYGVMNNEQKAPFKRMLLKGMNEKKYIEMMEDAIIDGGKSVLNGHRISYRIVSRSDIQKYLAKRQEMRYVKWHQIGMHKFYEAHMINDLEYHLLMAMKRVLVKNDKYLMRRDQFEMMAIIEKCPQFHNEGIERCNNVSCPAIFNCPKYIAFQMWREQQILKEEMEADDDACMVCGLKRKDHGFVNE